MAVQLDPQLLTILACPCPEHAPLRVGTPADPQADYLSCTACTRAFPVRDGIPVLLMEDAEQVAQDGTVLSAATAPTGVTSQAGASTQPSMADEAVPGDRTGPPDRNPADG